MDFLGKSILTAADAAVYECCLALESYPNDYGYFALAATVHLRGLLAQPSWIRAWCEYHHGETIVESPITDAEPWHEWLRDRAHEALMMRGNETSPLWDDNLDVPD